MVIIFYGISIISHRDRYYSKYAYARIHIRTNTHTHNVGAMPVMLLSSFPRAIFMCYFLTLNYGARQFYECGMCAYAWESASGLTMSPLSRYCPFCRIVSSNILGAEQNIQFKVRRMNCQWKKQSEQNTKFSVVVVVAGDGDGSTPGMRPNHYHSDRLSNYRRITWIMTNFMKYFANNIHVCVSTTKWSQSNGSTNGGLHEYQKLL